MILKIVLGLIALKHGLFLVFVNVWFHICRYDWMTNKLTELEQSGTLALFPPDWQMGRRITYEW
jgi:hypothetical protein